MSPIAKISTLPDITFRQLEIFSLVCRESSYANAAIEARTTRANVKRICETLGKVIGRPLLDESIEGRVVPNAFGREMLEQARPLARCSRSLADFVRGEHAAGRIVRFAAPQDQFQAGVFTDFVKRFGQRTNFRPCFLRMEESRFQSALLNAECDVYFDTMRDVSPRFDTMEIDPGETGPNRPGNIYMAVTRKHHPYAELLPALIEAARA